MIDDLRLLDKSNENRIEYIMASILQHLRKYNQLQGLFCANAEIAQIAYYAVIQMCIRDSLFNLQAGIRLFLPNHPLTEPIITPFTKYFCTKG